MESIQKQQESLLKTINGLHVSKKPQSRLDTAKELTARVSARAKELDDAVSKVGQFFETILNNELSDQMIDSQLLANGYRRPEETDLGIPNTATESNIDQFDLITQFIIHEKPSELREKAMRLISMCSSLIFERALVDQALQQARESKRELIGELLKIRLMKEKIQSPSLTNYRT